MSKKRNDIFNWKIHLVNMYGRNPEDISREVARELNIPWATAWDFKQKLVSGEGSIESTLTKPKILFTDIETAPVRADVWSLWGNFVGINQINADWFMLSHASAWMHDEGNESKVIYHDIRGKGKKSERMARLLAENDRHLCIEMWDLLDEADIVIGHNAKKFDIKKINARFLFWGLPIPSPYKVIDTLNIAKSAFALTSNKLDFLATHLGLPNKVHHEGHSLWTRCLKGEKSAWDIMEEYNRYDTVLLRDVYLKIRHYDKKHPNLALYYSDYAVRCNVCGSDNIKKVKGKSIKTNLSTFGSYQCKDCGAHLRDGQSELSKEKKQSLLRNIM